MNQRRKNDWIKGAAVAFCLFLTGCGAVGLAHEATFESAYENGEEEAVNIYTSQACGILEAIDSEEGTITLSCLDNGENLTLSYSGASMSTDRYGTPLVMSQICIGEIVAVEYNSEQARLGSITIAPDTWSYGAVSNYTLDEGRGMLQVGNDTYRISSDTRIFSGNRRIEFNQILDKDVLVLKGKGVDVFSIIIDNGHGYLKLVNEEKLIGGWIEVGQTVIQQIVQDMFFTVPEGDYLVRVSLGNIKETKAVSIARDQESLLDLGDIEIPQPVSGQAYFQITPSHAAVYVDNTYIDTSYGVRLPFGLHQLTASAEGYDTVSVYFDVQGEVTNVKLALGEKKETVSGNSASEKSGSHTITIREPADVEVYQDNLYMGIAPVTYPKSAGSHTISLRKAGHITTSYQIEVEEDDRDLVYAFPALLEGDSTISGNNLGKGGYGDPYGNGSAENNTADTVSGNSAAGERDDKQENKAGTVSGNDGKNLEKSEKTGTKWQE